MANVASPVVIQTQNQLAAPEMTSHRHKKVLKGLAITEISLGAYSMIIGFILLGYRGDMSPFITHAFRSYYSSSSRYSYYGYSYLVTAAEGVWCGIWVVAAGGLGVAAVGKRSTPCLINTHLGFSIAGAVFSTIQFIMACVFASNSVFVEKSFYVGLAATIAFVGFVSIVLLIVSSVYCCFLKGTCGGDCCGEAYSNPRPPHIAYVVTNPQQAGALPAGQQYTVNAYGQPFVQQPAPIAKQTPYNGQPVPVQQPPTYTNQYAEPPPLPPANS